MRSGLVWALSFGNTLQKGEEYTLVPEPSANFRAGQSDPGAAA